MRLTNLEPTEEFFMAGEVMVRGWTGFDDQGQHVVAFIAAVAVNEGEGALPTGLVSIPAPTEEDARRWAAEVMSRRYGEGP
jgi:hypothetical protein